ELEAVRASVRQKVLAVLRLAVDEETAPYVDAGIIEDHMFSNRRVERFGEGPAEVLLAPGEDPRSQMLAKKSRVGVDEGGKALSANRVFAYRDGLFEAMLHRFSTDPTMVAY